MMDSWTKKSGFPVVKVSMVNGSLTLEQYRFYTRPHKSDTSNDSKYLWNITITYATKSNANFSSFKNILWFDQKNDSMKINVNNDDWIIINLQQAGIYCE